MQYLNNYKDYILVKESFGCIGSEDDLNELFDFLKRRSRWKKPNSTNANSDARVMSDSAYDAAFGRIQKQIDKKESSEKNILFLKELVESIKSLNLKRMVIRSFLTLLAISLQTNEPITPNNKVGKKMKPLKIELKDVTRKAGIDFDKVYNDTLDRIKYTLPDEKAKYKSYEDLITYKTHLESRGNWRIWNKYGFMGLFQMGNNEVKGTGYGHVTFEKFKKDPSIWPAKDQRIAYDRLIRLNKYFLRNYMKYVGQTIGGIYITEGSIVGASTIGVGNVKSFLDSNGKTDPADAYGIKTSFLLKKFQPYDISKVKPMGFKEWQDYKHNRKK